MPNAQLTYNEHMDGLILWWENRLGYHLVSGSLTMEWDELLPDEWDLLPLHRHCNHPKHPDAEPNAILYE